MNLQKLIRYYHTIKPLKATQIIYRLKYRLFPVKKKTKLSFNNETVKRWELSSPHFAQQSLFDNGEVCFLNKRAIIRTATDWNDELQHEKLWLYNLHYFDDLNSIGADGRTPLQKDFVVRWIDENPPLIGNGWEPYTLSLRLVNWVKWCQRNQIFDSEILFSIEQQADALVAQLEYHILGNHLFANAKALVFVGCFLGGQNSADYLEKGLDLLQREVPEQFLSDGGHFELSPMYHCILLWDLIELFDLSQECNQSRIRECREQWRSAIEKGLSWLTVMCHPDGDISFFNDAAFGIAPTLADIERYAISVGIISPARELGGLVTLERSGYSRLQLGECVVIFDHASIGPSYLPGHAHADNLTFELSLGTERVFVNSGTSTYEAGNLREYQRSTPAHNTVSLKGENSSEMWASFRVSRRANSRLISSGEGEHKIWCEASHNGFRRLIPQAEHIRKIELQDSAVKVLDKVTFGQNIAVAHFHLHPDVEVVTSDNSIGIIELKLCSGKVLRFSSTGRMQVQSSAWYPNFGKSVVSNRIEVEFIDDQLETTIDWAIRTS